jgi:hypothetical protein
VADPQRRGSGHRPLVAGRPTGSGASSSL